MEFQQGRRRRVREGEDVMQEQLGPESEATRIARMHNEELERVRAYALEDGARRERQRIFPQATQTRNSRGEWVLAIPEPFYGVRKRCDCGHGFWTKRGYRGHYALVHVLALGD